MISLYRHLQDVHRLKNVHIKPYNILETAKSQLKVYHLDTKTKVEEEEDLEQVSVVPLKSAPGKVDLQDLAVLIYFLCTRERLWEE